jgi:LPXTG-site transpeptidase (sortase) family protein
MAHGAGRMTLELVLWILGIALLAIYLLATSWLEEQRRQAIGLFTQARAAQSLGDRLEYLPMPGQTAPLSGGEAVERVAGALPDIDEESLPVAVLRVARLGLEVPVYPDLSELNLSRGAGWIGGTSAPNTGGNMAIAAHRDRSFRPLKDIEVGDTVELESLSGSGEFRVSRIAIVDPDDVSVLDVTAVPTVTLVTCYPFYFIGNAPQRYIVQAVAVDRPAGALTQDAIPAAPPSGETP